MVSTLVNHRPWHHHWNTRRCKLGALGCGIWHRSGWWWSPCLHGDQASLGSAHEVLKDLSFKILKYTFSFYFITYYVKCYGVGLRGLCWNLTLIYTSISFLYKFFKSLIFGLRRLLNSQLTCTYLISKTHSSSELCFAANLWSDVKVCSPAVRMWTSLCLTQETF